MSNPKKLDASKLVPGKSYISETQYYLVENTIPQIDRIKVTNERGFSFEMGNLIAEEGSYSADQFNETKQVTRTELIEIFSKVGDTVFTVNFNKQPSADAVNTAIESANKGKILPIKDIKKIVKSAYEGEERTLIGYLLSTETGFGRSLVIDLEIAKDGMRKGGSPGYDPRVRQVDHRTLNWLIYKNVKYVVKK